MESWFNVINWTYYLSLIALADYNIKDYALYEVKDDPDTIIEDDNITPINIDDDEEEEKPSEKQVWCY